MCNQSGADTSRSTRRVKIREQSLTQLQIGETQVGFSRMLEESRASAVKGLTQVTCRGPEGHRGCDRRCVGRGRDGMTGCVPDQRVSVVRYNVLR